MIEQQLKIQYYKMTDFRFKAFYWQNSAKKNYGKFEKHLTCSALKRAETILKAKEW